MFLDSLRTLLPQDEDGNAKVGKDIRLYECKNCVAHAADESKVVVQGLDGYIVAEKNGQLLVCSLKRNKGSRNLESNAYITYIQYYSPYLFLCKRFVVDIDKFLSKIIMDNINVHFDKNFDLLWQKGIVKWYDGIYLITSLLYLKSLEDIERVDVGVKR